MRTVLTAIVLAAVSTAAFAQYDASDPRSNVYNNESLRRQDEIRRNEEAARTNQNSENMYGSKPSSPSTGGGYSASPSGGSSAGQTDYRALGKELLRLPPLPVERNVLLGNWRLEGGGQQDKVLEFGLTGRGATPGMGEMMGFLKSIESGQLTCDMSFGRGISFTPKTFSSGGAAGMVGGPVAYRSRKKGVIVAIPGDSRANPMFFKIVGQDRIESVNIPCALVRVGTPAANAAANATTAPGNARAGAASPSAPTASTIQYGSYVCGNERVEVFYCRNDRGQPVPEIDNSCAVEYPDRPRRNPSFPVSAAVRKSDLVKQLATCKLT